MSADFKAKFPKTRVILDHTEVKCQMPSSPVLNSKLYSSYKNQLTLKGRIGIAPSCRGNNIVSQLYTGSMSEREIVERSGVLDLPFSERDDIVADKGFTINDLLPLGVSLNIPPFLGQAHKMSSKDVVKKQVIAALRIHVERALDKIKLHRYQTWAVSAFLCNVQDPLLSEQQ
ncbi:uncharacterized protein [Montipora foliosa]|uniref:uncharacterized protein n=1 Tax=Montipora foliosa TaxID=591990 RepID=UPI0035F1C514